MATAVGCMVPRKVVESTATVLIATVPIACSFMDMDRACLYGMRFLLSPRQSNGLYQTASMFCSSPPTRSSRADSPT